MIKTLKICQVTTGVTFLTMQNSIHSCRTFMISFFFFLYQFDCETDNESFLL